MEQLSCGASWHDSACFPISESYYLHSGFLRGAFSIPSGVVAPFGVCGTSLFPWRFTMDIGIDTSGECFSLIS